MAIGYSIHNEKNLIILTLTYMIFFSVDTFCPLFQFKQAISFPSLGRRTTDSEQVIKIRVEKLSFYKLVNKYSKIFRIAILPLSNHSFRLNDTKKIRGFDRLRERHLSILGYDVVQICYREWNSIHMNLPGAREEFLRKFLYKYNTLIN